MARPEPAYEVVVHMLRTAVQEQRAAVFDRVTGARHTFPTSASTNTGSPKAIGWIGEGRLYLHPGETARFLSLDAARRGITWGHSPTSLGALLNASSDIHTPPTSTVGRRTTVRIYTPDRRRTRVWDLPLTILRAQAAHAASTGLSDAAVQEITAIRRDLLALDRRLAALLGQASAQIPG